MYTLAVQILRELEEGAAPADKDTPTRSHQPVVAPDPMSQNVWLNRNVRFIAAGKALESEYGIANSALWVKVHEKHYCEKARKQNQHKKHTKSSIFIL